MNKRILLICTTDSMISSFLIPYIRRFEQEGYAVSCFCSRTGDHFEKLQELGVEMTEIPFSRNPFTPQNIRAYRLLKRRVKSAPGELVFCHEPVGGVMGRMIGRAFHIPVVYMVHGFHFYRGAPALNWALFYPIERLMSRFTDLLITINKEDCRFAQTHMKAKRMEYLPGVGIDVSRYAPEQFDRAAKRMQLGLKDGDIAILSVGELNRNKNHIAVLDAIRRTGRDDLHYLIAGVGEQRDMLERKAREYGMEDRLHLLGYRRDCPELYAAADIFCLPSYREGLPVALLEAMAGGLPVVASRIRGNVDLMDERGGILLAPDDIDGFARAIETVSRDQSARLRMGEYNRERAKAYSIDTVMDLFWEQLCRGIPGGWHEQGASILN